MKSSLSLSIMGCSYLIQRKKTLRIGAATESVALPGRWTLDGVQESGSRSSHKSKFKSADVRYPHKAELCAFALPNRRAVRQYWDCFGRRAFASPGVSANPCDSINGINYSLRFAECALYVQWTSCDRRWKATLILARNVYQSLDF